MLRRSRWLAPMHSARRCSKLKCRKARKCIEGRPSSVFLPIVLMFNLVIVFYTLDGWMKDRSANDRYDPVFGTRDHNKLSAAHDMETNNYEPHQLRVVWEMHGNPCTGFGQETTNLVLGLTDFKNIRLLSESPSICNGLSGEDLFTNLASKNISAWSDIDVYISHMPASSYPSFPHRAWNDKVLHIPRHPR
jgi:hypothetical protein